MGLCAKCADKSCHWYGSVAIECLDFKPETNADKIRAMTDEELADFLDRWALGDIDYSQTFCSLCKGQYDCRDDCLLGWLKREVET